MGAHARGRVRAPTRRQHAGPGTATPGAWPGHARSASQRSSHVAPQSHPLAARAGCAGVHGPAAYSYARTSQWIRVSACLTPSNEHARACAVAPVYGPKLLAVEHWALRCDRQHQCRPCWLCQCLRLPQSVQVSALRGMHDAALRQHAEPSPLLTSGVQLRACLHRRRPGPRQCSGGARGSGASRPA